MKSILSGWQDAAFALAIVAACAGVLALLAFTRPTETTAGADHVYNQDGEFAYSAASAAPDLFDSGAVETGEPVFFSLSDTVDFRFDYRFASEDPHAFSGMAGLSLEVRESGGWKRTLVLQAPAAFEGSETTVAGSLKLADLQGLMATFIAQTGVERPQFTLAILPEVSGTGTFGSDSVDETFAPQLSFAIDDQQVRLEQTDEGDPLKPSQQGLLRYTQTIDNTIGLMGFSLDVSTARVLGVAVVALCAVLGVALWWMVAGPGAPSESLSYARRRGHPVVRVANGSASQTGAPIIDLRTFEDLAEVAEQEATVILEELWRPRSWAYLVHSQGIVYRWRPVALAPNNGAGIKDQHRDAA